MHTAAGLLRRGAPQGGMVFRPECRTLGFMETVRTLDLMGHFPKAVEDLDARIAEVLLPREVRDAAALLVGRPRTPDAIHVASALSPRDDLTALVTYDRGVLETARAEGLPADAPGMADRPGAGL